MPEPARVKGGHVDSVVGHVGVTACDCPTLHPYVEDVIKRMTTRLFSMKPRDAKLYIGDVTKKLDDGGYSYALILDFVIVK